MDCGKWIPDGSIDGDEPVWEPILALLGEFLTSHFFMWMFESELEGGITVQAYKHRVTRRYLFIDQSGLGYEWRQGCGYRQRSLLHLTEQVFEGMAEQHWEEGEYERYSAALRRIRRRMVDERGHRA